MNANNTAHEQRFNDAAREGGCIVTGSPMVQIHHLWGSRFRHRKLHIGNYAILPIAPEYHDINSDHPFNVTKHKRAFWEEFGTYAELYQKLIDRIEKDYKKEILPPQEVIDSILDWGQRN